MFADVTHREPKREAEFPIETVDEAARILPEKVEKAP
jgi:hypothetical protein